MSLGSRICMENPKAEDSDDEVRGALSEFGDILLNKPCSGSSVEAGSSPTSSVHELLICPVCTNSMYPPIHQCPNGHTLCSSCKVRVHNICPTCRHELGNIRCLALEKVAESLKLPCKHQTMGCPGIFLYYEKLEHEHSCKFRPYNCPYAGSECLITGDISLLVAHLKDDHKVDMHDGCAFNHRYVKSSLNEVENATWMLTETNDRLLLWKMNRLHKDGTWTSEDARQRWELACSILAESNLTPEDENTEENEKVFRIVMGPEHPGRVRCKGLGVTPSKYYSQGSSSSTASSYVSAGSARHVEQLETRVGGLQTEVGGMKTEMGGLKSEMGSMKSEMKSEIGRINETLTHLVSFLKRKSKKKSKKSKQLSTRERQDDDDEA